MQLITGVVRPYPWGSRTHLARLQGRPAPSPIPEAELWLGAHPAAPCTIGSQTLATIIADDPVGQLGETMASTFGPRLPYLMKLLAAERPLSLQAHPDAQRAAIQHAAGNPNYTDGYHKPELLVALEPFEVLSGFRHPAASAHLLARVPALADVVELLRRGDLRAATIALLSASVRLIDDVLADTLSLMPQQHDLLQRLTEHHPRDPGALVALLLNHQVLNPGEAVYTPAGNLHAYVRGFGVEIMAASDNVLRAGLTTKIVDIPELLEVVRFEPLANPVVAAEPINADLVHWPAPVPEFSLHKACVDTHTPSVELPGNGPRIVVCTRGQVKVNGLTLSQGDTAYARATEPAISVSGNGHVFQASPG